MPDHTPHPSASAWAEVRANDHVVRYRRSGGGPIAILLADDDQALPWPGLDSALERRHRLLIPRFPGGNGVMGEDGLGGFLEGLGARAVSIIVVHQPLVTPVIALALRQPDVIARIAIVTDTTIAEGTPVGLLRDEAADLSPTRLLLLPRALDAVEAIPALLGFLGWPSTPSRS